MKPIEVPYDEAIAIDEMKKLFKKNDGYSFLVPISKQQKGYDFVILNSNTKKIMRVQVKGSKTYQEHKKYKYYFWFNNFIDKLDDNVVDAYVFVCSCEEKGRNIKQARRTNMLLAFDNREMKSVLKKAVTKKDKKPDKFIGIGSNDLLNVFGDRVLLDGHDFTKQLLTNKAETLQKWLL